MAFVSGQDWIRLLPSTTSARLANYDTVQSSLNMIKHLPLRVRQALRTARSLLMCRQMQRHMQICRSVSPAILNQGNCAYEKIGARLNLRHDEVMQATSDRMGE